jgi:hypothetical protein
VEQVKGIMKSLKKDRLGNVSPINFSENNHITGIARMGNSFFSGRKVIATGFV